MKIKSAKSFRYWYKTKIKEIDRNDPTYNENFVGTYHKENGKKTIKGFFEMYHGDKPDIASYLPSILKIAEDGQAIYEFLQNAVDCGSTHFYIFYNDNYFLAINNGSPFDVEGLQSILNIAQTTKKDPDKIGRFGIGFKLAHRLVGKNEGTDELVRQYKGPILFSWSKLEDLESLLKNEQIEPLDPNKENYQEYINSPYLLKLLLTNFPSDPDERVKDINYQDKILFPQEELKELVDFLNENFQQHSDSLKKNVLKQGSLFFIKLGEDKKKLLDKDYSELVNGIQYSMNTLKRLQKVYINNVDIGKTPLQLEEGIIKKGSDEFERISPEYKEFDIKFAIGFNSIKFGSEKSYEQIKLLKEKPNFYKYFPMGDEINGLGFIIHCDSFSNESNRRKLHEDDVNRNLFPELAKFITQRLDEYKVNDRNKFLNLYASLLLSDVPERQNNKWLKPVFYDTILSSLQKNIPTKTDFSENAQNVKINKLKQQLDLSAFGINDIEWFEWDNEADNLLIDEATKKLDIKEWDIRDIIENATLVNINIWIASCNNETYEAFLKELEESYLRKETIEKLYSVKLFKFSDGNFYSVNDIWVTKNFTDTYQERTYNQHKRTYEYINKTRVVQKTVLNQSIHFTINKTDSISNELQNLGFTVSLKNITTYTKIYSAIADKLPTEKDIYNSIAEKCKTNALSAEEKKNLFLNFINETTKFDNVADSTLKDLCLFCDAKDNIKPLSELLDSSLRTPAWLNPYKIKTEEHFKELSPYLIQEEDLFDKIILPNIEIIKEELTEAKKIKELVTFFKENHRSFFNEYIIKKQTNDYEIIDKSDKFQIIPPKDERKTFIDFIENYLSDELIVLPYDFSDFNDQNGILKGEKLHSQILELVDVDEHKETLVDIIHYDEPKRKFLQKLTVFRFNSETEYTKDDYQYKVLDLACNELKERNDIQIFREKVIIVTEQGERRLSEISLANDRVKINNKEFSLSKILPATHQNSNLVGDLISLFTKQGISNDKLNAFFGVNEALDLNDTFKKFTEQVQTFANPEQFFFLIYYNKYIEKVDLSKLDFDLNCAVFPSEFALEKEKLPEYVQNWITKKEIDLSELDEIGVFTENSALVSLRKFFLSQTDFNINTIAEKLSSNEIMLLNTFELLKEKGIELSTDNEFSVFKEIVRVINTSRTDNAKLKEKEERYDFQRLEHNSTQDKTIKGYTIYLYNSQMPNLVQLNEMGDYVFYRYNNGDYAVNGNKIYINDTVDRNNVLMQVATYLNDNDFTVSLFGSQNDTNEIEKLREEIQKLKEEKTNDNQNEPSNKPIKPKSFLDEVNDFIAELEETDWNNYVPELKNLLLDFNNQPEEKRKLFNLIAKIKLTKEKNVKFEESDEGYNVVKIGDEKYFVHSARGAFAYIHPSELLKMKNDGYRMGIDFGKKFKIYENVEDIFELNKVHLLAYQSQNTTEDLLSFCQANRDANKHLLIIDKDNASEKSQALLKLLNIEDDYQ